MSEDVGRVLLDPAGGTGGGSEKTRPTSVAVDLEQFVALAVDAARSGDVDTLSRAIAVGRVLLDPMMREDVGRVLLDPAMREDVGRVLLDPAGGTGGGSEKTRPTSVAVDLEQLVALAVDAARSGDVDTLSRAIAAGVPVDATSPRGDSLLMLACYHGHTGAVQLLLEKGADANQPDGKGQTPLAGVAFKGLIDVAELLVAGGAIVDAASADGRTPLMMAAAFNRVEMVAWLMERGASADTRDAAGLRAIDVARAMGANDVVAILST